MDNVSGLMYASEKYMPDVIKNECKKFLAGNINEDYACVVLQTAHSFYLEDLQNDALQFIFSHGQSCLESTSFLSLSSGCAKLIIESDKLNCREEIVYQKLIQWAEQQCSKEQHVTVDDEQHVTGDDEQPVTGAEEQHVIANAEPHVTGNDEQHVTGDDEQPVNGAEEQHVIANDEQHVTANDEQLRKVLGNLIYLIRFPVMDREYYANEVSTKNVLTADEKVEIFQSFHNKPINTFPANVRLSISMLEVCRCEANWNRIPAWNQAGANDCLNFTISWDCYIYGIIVFGSKHYSGHHAININILNGSTLLGSTSTKLTSVPGKASYPIDLAEPLRILKNIRYTIELNMKGNNCFRGKDYKTIVKIDDISTVTFADSLLSTNGTDSRRGQIPGIILSRSFFR